MPKALCKQSKDNISSAISYFEAELENGGPLLPLNAVRERLSNALNVHLATVHKISAMVKKGQPLTSPKRKRSRTKRIVSVDDFAQCAIRNTIYEMYRNKQHVTLKTLNILLRERDIFKGGTTSLWKVLKDIGFHFSKDNPKRVLMELHDVVLKRVTFLQNYIRFKNENMYEFVFLDETWIFQDGNIAKSWQDNNVQSVKTRYTGGKRYIILHAGNRHGFIPGADLVFSSTSHNIDYHGDMNRGNFLQWFENQLLHNLENPSVIVMDNASYRSTLINKAPTSSSTKGQIQEWLSNNNVNYERTALKVQLLELVQRNKPQPSYEADTLALQYGHIVLRLPPYHCIFNPIEIIWGIIKRYYNNNIGKYGRSEEAIIKLWQEALSQGTAEAWSNSIRHTEEEIQRWWGFDQENVEPLIINLSENESSTNTDTE